MFKKFILVALLLSAYTSAFAAPEEEGDKKKVGSVFGAHVGPLLPNQIPGMTEIMPTWGVRYGFPIRKGLLELGAASSNSRGVSYYNGSLSMRGDIQLDDLNGIVQAGLDTHYYKPEGSTFKMMFGGHVGGGFAAHLGDLLWFRSDMIFNVNPGTSLYIGFGFEWRMPPGEAAAGGDQK